MTKRRTLSALMALIALLFSACIPLSAARAQDAPDKQVKDGTIKVKVLTQLPAVKNMPVIYSADGKSLLYFTRNDEGQFTYHRADGDGKNSKKLYQTTVDWDDILNAITDPGALASSDGRVAVATTLNGGSARRNDDPLRAGIVGKDGKMTKVKSDFAQVMGFGFVKDQLIYIDSQDFRSGKLGYALNSWNGKESKVVFKKDDAMGAILRMSPDQKHAGFFEGKPPERKFRIRIVDLNAGTSMQTELFRTDDITFDGAPSFCWDARGQGVFYHKATGDQGKTPFSMMYFDLKTKKATAVKAPVNVATIGALDDKHVLVWEGRAARDSILRLSDGKIFVMDDQNTILGGNGKHIAYVKEGEEKVNIASIELNE